MTEWEFSKVKYVCRYCTEERVGSTTIKVCNHCLNDDPAKLCRLKDCPLFDKEEDTGRENKMYYSYANEGNNVCEPDEIRTLTEENKKLKEQVEGLEKRIRDLMHAREVAYSDGVIAGLKFSIRCNGVSGNEVKG